MAARHSQRGILNWVHDQFFAHARARFQATVENTSVVDREPTRDIYVGHTFRFRLKKHTADDMVSSYPTDAFLAFALQDPPQLIQEVRLIGGYRWDPETREIGTGWFRTRRQKQRGVGGRTRGDRRGGRRNALRAAGAGRHPAAAPDGRGVRRDREGRWGGMSSLGEVIITGRVAAGMTQADLANTIGVTQAAMSRYENDLRDPDPDTIDRIADALGVTVRFLERASRPSAALAVDAHMRLSRHRQVDRVAADGGAVEHAAHALGLPP